MPPCVPKRAFTLIELLSAIAVLAVIAAILIPAVSGLRDRAAGTKSVSNLRQIGVSMSLYLIDNNGDYPHWVIGVTPTWYDLLSEGGDYGLPQLKGTSGYSEVFYSPLSDKKAGGGWPAHNPDYGINLAVVNDRSGASVRARKANSVQNPSSLVLMASTGSYGDALNGDFRFDPLRFSQVDGGYRASAASYSSYGWMAFRYPPPTGGAGGDMSGSSAAALYCDWHVELLPFDDPRLQTQEGRRKLLLPIP